MIIAIRHIHRRKLNQNAFFERFNRTYREWVLKIYASEGFDELKEITHNWLIACKERGTHDALGGLFPTDFRERQTTENSTCELTS